MNIICQDKSKGESDLFEESIIFFVLHPLQKVEMFGIFDSNLIIVKIVCSTAFRRLRRYYELKERVIWQKKITMKF